MNGRHPLQDPLEVIVTVLADGIGRVSIREVSPLHTRFEVFLVITSSTRCYCKCAHIPKVPDVIEESALKTHSEATWSSGTVSTRAAWKNMELVVQHSPFQTKLLVDGVEQLVTNDRSKLVLIFVPNLST